MMECLVKKVPKACMQLCDKKVYLDTTITDPEVRNKKKILCYQRSQVPKEFYGAKECTSNNPNVAFPLNYAICLKTNGVEVN